MLRLLGALGLTLLLSACGGGGPSASSATVRAEGTEAASNETSKSISGSTLTLSAQAQFERYDDYGYDSGSSKGLVHLGTYNIRYAEVQLFNSSGTLIQAGTTDGSGNLTSFVMPKTAGTYRLEVHSRGYNSHVKASVLNNPYDKQYYTISKTFTLTGSESSPYAVTLPKATTTDGVLAGAFNILYDIVLVNEYLATHAGTHASNPDYCPSAICSGTSFTPTYKVQAYWTPGLTPATYYGDSTTPISFFVPSSGGGVYEGLYILGGIEGSTCTDTDHFDNSVIVHEYGHFLEKAYGRSDSPGGSHDGNGIIDPRLAWSEGWADFLQTIVLARAFYRDTKGNASCSNGARLSFSDFILNTHDGNDTPVYAGDGNFREMAIARMLRSTVVGNSQGANYPANSNGVSANFGFAAIWNAFNGDKTSSFRNVGHITQQIYGYLSSFTTIADPDSNAWSDDAGTYGGTAVLEYEKTRHDLKDYGAPVTAMSSCASSPNSTWFPRVISALEPVADTYQGGALVNSDPLNTNDFYAYYYDGTANHAVINLNYKADVAGTPYDLDMYLYSNSYTFLDGDSILRKSEGYYPEGGAPSGYTGHEQINLSGLAAGTYMINIKVDYSGGARKAATQYSLVLGNGDDLCP